MTVILLVFTTLVGALLPALFWLTFFFREETHRESARLMAYVFGAGALMSLPVLGLQMGFQGLVGIAVSSIVVIIVLALIEETLKFVAGFAAAHRDPALHEPIDAMMVMVVASLGFATVENLFIIGTTLTDLSAASLGGAAETLALRTVGATLLHTLISASVGYAWARGRIGAMRAGIDPQAFAENAPRHELWKDFVRPIRRWVLGGIIFATALHAAFNLLVLAFQKEHLFYPTVLLILVAAIVFRDFESLKPKS
ncbi:MAG: PrsW family glutamic-type intramembrane protease [bacterium]|nr:PrsW family glutamic-type intramembrane protease [bacterium]